MAKWLEGACYSLKLRKSPKMEALVDEVADLFVSAQQEDGYLNSYITTVAPHKRWKDLSNGYELSCAGHFFEAAVAHFEATGKRKLLDTAQGLLVKELSTAQGIEEDAMVEEIVMPPDPIKPTKKRQPKKKRRKGRAKTK